jgi:hypothetical protein
LSQVAVAVGEKILEAAVVQLDYSTINILLLWDKHTQLL